MYRQLCAAHNNNSEKKKILGGVCVCVCVLLGGGSLVFNFQNLHFQNCFPLHLHPASRCVSSGLAVDSCALN